MIVTSGKGLPSWSLTSPTIELVPKSCAAAPAPSQAPIGPTARARVTMIQTVFDRLMMTAASYTRNPPVAETNAHARTGRVFAGYYPAKSSHRSPIGNGVGLAG